MDLFKENKALVGIAVIIVALLGWYMLSQSDGSSSSGSLITSTSANSATSAGDRDLLQTLVNMRNIRLDGHIFESPTFLSLQDFSRSIVPEPVGRPDPFEPVTVATTSNPELDREAQGLFR